MPTPSERITSISKGHMEGWEVYVEGIRRQQAGDDILMLAIGDHDFPTPVDTVNACKAALDAGHTNYTSMQGIPKLVDAVAKVSSEIMGHDISNNEVIAFAGGQAGLYAALQATINPGDHVIILSPHYVTYPGTVRAAGGTFTLVECQPEDGFEPIAENIEAAITPKTRALMINTPNNPTCAIYSRKTLEAIADLCKRQDLWLMSDEVYWSLSGGKHVAPGSLPGMAERTISIHSMSKSHVMTGWRVGWIIADPAIVHLLQQHTLVNNYGLSDFISHAAAEALENRYGVDELTEIYTSRGKAFLDALEGANGIRALNEPGSMYFMLDMREVAQDTQHFAFELLKQENLCIMPGESFGPSAAGHLRVSLCRPENELAEGARRLRRLAANYSA